MKDCTFKPKITRKGIQTDRGPRPRNQLYEGAEITARKLEMQRKKDARIKQKEEIEQCTFKPKINRN